MKTIALFLFSLYFSLAEWISSFGLPFLSTCPSILSISSHFYEIRALFISHISQVAFRPSNSSHGSITNGSYDLLKNYITCFTITDMSDNFSTVIQVATVIINVWYNISLSCVMYISVFIFRPRFVATSQKIRSIIFYHNGFNCQPILKMVKILTKTFIKKEY